MAEKYSVVEVNHASAAETATGQSAALNVPTFSEAVAYLHVTAASGTTPSMTVKLQSSADGGTTWHDDGSAFAAVTAAGASSVLKLTNFGALVRYVWTITGTTPSFTFALRTVLKG